MPSKNQRNWSFKRKITLLAISFLSLRPLQKVLRGNEFQFWSLALLGPSGSRPPISVGNFLFWQELFQELILLNKRIVTYQKTIGPKDSILIVFWVFSAFWAIMVIHCGPNFAPRSNFSSGVLH